MSEPVELTADDWIDNVADIVTPALAVYPARIREHIAATIAMAGSPSRLRPHVKTHKTIELTQLALEAGIRKHKCATIPEAEILARAGATDIVLAYTLVGPNIERFVQLVTLFPRATFRPLVDHPAPALALEQALERVGKRAEVLVDLDEGMGRTGIEPGDAAISLIRQVVRSTSLSFAGVHLYDGHHHQESAEERRAGSAADWDRLRRFLKRVDEAGIPVPRIVAGGSPTFPFWAEVARGDERVECSPGTLFLNDWNYFRWFRDLPFRPAAVLLSRVISRPRANRVTLDLGSKAVAADSPLADRVHLLNVPEAVLVRHNEEHLVVESPAADRFQPGDLVYAWPAHICPTCALHRELLVIENHRRVSTWPVLARDRVLSC